MIASFGGRESASLAYVVSRRQFSVDGNTCSTRRSYLSAGHELVGEALIDAKGELIGVGSLTFPTAAQPGHAIAGQHVVPIDLLKGRSSPDLNRARPRRRVRCGRGWE